MPLWFLGNYEKSIWYKLLVLQDFKCYCRTSQLKMPKSIVFPVCLLEQNFCSSWTGRSCVSEPIRCRATGGRPEVSARLRLHSLFLLFAGSWSIKSDRSRLNNVELRAKSASVLLGGLRKSGLKSAALWISISCWLHSAAGAFCSTVPPTAQEGYNNEFQ